MCKFKYSILLLAISCFLLACSSKNKTEKEVTLFAAASLTNVMTEIANEYTKKTGVNVRLNFASSGILARQIENGANFDYYVSASKEWIAYVDEKQLVSHSSVKSIANNKLVAIVPIDSKITEQDSVSILRMPDLFKGRLSIGDPLHVPAGKYANQIINNYSWNEDLNKRILPAKNARDALFIVEMGEVEMGIVYSSDAKNSTKVKVIFEFKKRDCDPIVYYAASKMNKDKKTDDFVRFINGSEVKTIWKKNGFNVN